MAGMLLLCTVLPACTGAAPTAPITEDPAIEEPTGVNGEITGWADILGETSAPDGWQIIPCENPVLLCIQTDGEIFGTVERFSYPLSEVTLQGGAPKTPEAQRQFLEAWVADHYETIRSDRAGADPNLQFAEETPASVPVGSLAGLRYGYTITHPNGAVFDRSVGYVATDGDQVYVFVTGVISGDPSGSFGNEADFATFEPHLATMIEGLRL